MESNTGLNDQFDKKNILGKIFNDFYSLPIMFREGLIEALEWDRTTFHKKTVKGAELTQAEQDIIISITESILVNFGEKLKKSAEDSPVCS